MPPIRDKPESAVGVSIGFAVGHSLYEPLTVAWKPEIRPGGNPQIIAASPDLFAVFVRYPFRGRLNLPTPANWGLF